MSPRCIRTLVAPSHHHSLACAQTPANSLHQCVTGDALLDWVAGPNGECELENCVGHGGCDKRWDPNQDTQAAADGTTNTPVRCGHAMTVYGPEYAPGQRHVICKAIF